jgi:hypothetical protein
MNNLRHSTITHVHKTTNNLTKVLRNSQNQKSFMIPIRCTLEVYHQKYVLVKKRRNVRTDIPILLKYILCWPAMTLKPRQTATHGTGRVRPNQQVKVEQQAREELPPPRSSHHRHAEEHI